MSLPKEWLMPLARTLVRNGAKGPVYALGDQITWFTHEYATRRLKASGLLRNASVAGLPSSHNSRMTSFRSVVEMLGFGEYYDVDANGRASVTADLSLPLPEQYKAKAGVVIDIGTCEHIFNFPQVFTNIIELLRPGGTVVHLAPLSWYNHGFVNFNPIAFREFYEHNGFEVRDHGLIVAPFEYTLECILSRLGLAERYFLSNISPASFVLNDESRTLARLANHLGIGARVLILFAARKPMENLPVSFPHQAMYRQTVAGSSSAEGYEK
jgi:SAM-dependent methyltransferase